MYFVLMSMTMSLLAQENAQAVAQGENKIDEKVEHITKGGSRTGGSHLFVFSFSKQL